MLFQQAISHLESDCEVISHTVNDPEIPSNERHELTANHDELKNAISFLKVANLGGLSSLVALIRQWGVDRNIIGANKQSSPHQQHTKLVEEVDEILEGIRSADQHAIIDGIGDATVVLIQLAELVGTRFESCLLAAYEEIKNRSGVMQNGVFVKN